MHFDLHVDEGISQAPNRLAVVAAQKPAKSYEILRKFKLIALQGHPTPKVNESRAH